jgi:preprotein translocase subunit SecD
MQNNNNVTLVGILLLFVAALYISLPIDHPLWLEEALAPGENTQRDIRDLTLGLDLKGGTQVLLEVDLPEGQSVEAGALDTAKVIVEQRVNGLGVSEPNVQLQGEVRMIVELPGVSNPDQANSFRVG